jgi:hypothetical protein
VIAGKFQLPILFMSFIYLVWFESRPSKECDCMTVEFPRLQRIQIQIIELFICF